MLLKLQVHCQTLGLWLLSFRWFSIVFPLGPAQHFEGFTASSSARLQCTIFTGALVVSAQGQLWPQDFSAGFLTLLVQDGTSIWSSWWFPRGYHPFLVTPNYGKTILRETLGKSAVTAPALGQATHRQVPGPEARRSGAALPQAAGQLSSDKCESHVIVGKIW